MSYDFNVPYIDFVNEFDENDGADTFFDVNCQLGKLNISEDKNSENENHNIPKSKEEGGDERKGELDVRKSEESLVETVVDSNEDQVASSEIGEENQEHDGMKSCATKNKFDPVKCDDKNRAGKIRSKKSDMPDILSEISDAAQNIKNNKRKSDAAHGVSKFISLAESIQKFQVATPPRFHSRPKGQKGATRNQYIIKQHVTIPQSPNLLSKARSRPVDYPTAEEREKKEIEEVLSHKLEVHPMNPKVFEAPKCGKRVPKQPVVVEPFNLTEFKKKKESKKSDSPFRFKAQSVPKGILQHPIGVPEKKPIPVTNPTTPLVLSKYKQKLRFPACEMIDGKPVITSKDANHTGISMEKKANSKTEPKPFSFEERDKMMMKHKEEMIQKVYKEEKEAREFHAKPLPNYLKKINKTLDTTMTSIRSSDNEEEKKPVFRAQPAAVLRRQPFVPKLSQRSVLDPAPLLLATEERAKQRAEFDAAREQHRREIEAELQMRKEIAEQQARDEEALLRQQTIHRAQPIRCYKAVPEVLRAPLTSPRSPCFSDRRNASKK